ncbi:MAG: Bacterial type II secretion system protein I [candidate division BRC1 bacterium ADurb.BinA364]|nr:MAG: Bacterial type II secretion system protein I [candidate division BRC1 bacterium ADurb.BinA364]
MSRRTRHGIGRRRTGFSLIETLAALFIFGIALVGLIQGIAAALGQWRQAEETTKALMLAENVMEEILYNTELAVGQDGGQYDPPDDRYSWSSTVDTAEIEGLYRITVSVTWGADERQRNVTLTTLKARRDASQWQYAPNA